MQDNTVSEGQVSSTQQPAVANSESATLDALAELAAQTTTEIATPSSTVGVEAAPLKSEAGNAQLAAQTLSDMAGVVAAAAKAAGVGPDGTESELPDTSLGAPMEVDSVATGVDSMATGSFIKVVNEKGEVVKVGGIYLKKLLL